MKESTILTDRQDRYLYLDIVKGIAIFLMLWGHCIQYCTNNEFDFFENPAFKFIYSFHMPLFMLVSGYLFVFSCKKRELKDLLIHRTQALLQPIVMCTIFNYIISDVILSRHPTNLIGANWLGQLSSLWFLWSVFAASIVLGVAYKAFNNTIIRVTIALFGVVLVRFFPNIDLNTFMYPYFLLGFIFALLKPKLPKLVLNLKYISLVIFPIMLFFYEKKHYIYITGIRDPKYNVFTLIQINLFRWIIGLAGSVFVLVFIEWVMIFVQKQRFFYWLGKKISLLGRKSLQIYCISVSLLSFSLANFYPFICSIVGCNFLSDNIILYSFVYTPIIAICFAIALYYVVKLFEKIKISKLLFGR